MKISLLWTIFLTFVSSNRAANQEDELLKYLQPNDVEDSYVFATDPYNCTRKCVKGDNRICYYQFNAENYATLNDACYNCTTGQSCYRPQCVTADGFKRGILTVNRRLPGPSIQVCQGDRIIVDVLNKMSGRSFTIHWHGLFQKGTPYYDGVPMVSQCPILENNRFRYNLVARQQGSFFWHSHNGVQKVDGLQGSLIVRRPPGEDPNENLYDEDLPAHVVTVMDWFHMNSDDHFPGIVDPEPQLYATYFLIKGRGRYTDPNTNASTTTPLSEFLVTRGKRYRFRVIGAICDNCHFRLSIQDHPLTLIATDGNAVKPVQVDYVEISSGERYDFVINANATGGAYWIEVRAQGFPCALYNKMQLAVLRYEGSNSTELTVVREGTDFNFPGVDLNPNNSTCNGSGICVAQLQAIEDFDPRIMDEPDVNFPMNIGYYYPSVEEEFHTNTYTTYVRPADAPMLSLWVNNVSYSEAPSPLLSQRGDIPRGTLCPLDNNGYPHCSSGDHCFCTSVFKVPLNALVQVIIMDRSAGAGINHPIHLHGFAFNVMAMGYLKDLPESAELIEDLMKTNNLTKSPVPVLKDTVDVPSQGYTVIRFIADNPGYWFFHCHFIYHHVGGMALVLQVGDSDEYPKIPANFPKCGSYLPPVELD